MDFKQNQKINQVIEKTLVVGIDIAKRTHFACFVDTGDGCSENHSLYLNLGVVSSFSTNMFWRP